MHDLFDKLFTHFIHYADMKLCARAGPILCCIVSEHLYSAFHNIEPHRSAFVAISSKKTEILRRYNDVERLEERKVARVNGS